MLINTWVVSPDFIIDEEPPAWATKAAWRYFTSVDQRELLRAWVDEENTKYQYLRGFNGVCAEYGVIYSGNFFDDYWKYEAHLFAVKTEAPVMPNQPMVCHDKFGFMTDEFRRYSQGSWDKTRDEVREIIRAAIRDGVSPIAMKELLSAAVDCGTTLAMTEMKVEHSRK